MAKQDLKKTLAALYKGRPGKPVEVRVPKLRYLMIDGQGDPNGPAFMDAIVALYGLSYGLKFQAKNGPTQRDWTVMGLEGLWWAEDMQAFSRADRAHWRWTAMIMQPTVVGRRDLQAVIATMRSKGKLTRAMEQARIEDLVEGECVQVLYVGPYSAEGPTITDLHTYAASLGKRLRGKHHEIYLSDARRTAPEKLRTILRQPVERAHHSG
ncbi:MAG: GyrI-like domain-containing protein [Flavobacteriales bacterium]|nr:GyrI-like domain-containing protein [Flavobacteriales bacterium]MCB9168441.1 GyrI-like domain-containing protein [Flavobacteriales bacterium]